MKKLLAIPVIVLTLVSFVEAQGRGRAGGGGRIGGGGASFGGGRVGGGFSGNVGGGSAGSFRSSPMAAPSGRSWSGAGGSGFSPGGSSGTSSFSGGANLGSRSVAPSGGANLSSRSTSVGSSLGTRSASLGGSAIQSPAGSSSGLSLGTRSLSAPTESSLGSSTLAQAGSENLLSQRRFGGARQAPAQQGGSRPQIAPGGSRAGTVQPGAGQQGAGRLGTGQRGTQQPGGSQLGAGTARPGLDQRGQGVQGTQGRLGEGTRGSTLPGLDGRGGDGAGTRQEQARGRAESRPQTTDERRSQLNDRFATSRQGLEDGAAGRQSERVDGRSERQERASADASARQAERAESRDFDQESWQDFRNQNREDWQDHMNQSREDWQQWGTENNPYNQPQNVTNNYYGPYPWWGGAYYPGAYWNFMWDNYPVWAAFQVTAWTVNRAAWAFGYWPYANPYVVTSPVVVYDYSQPLVVSQTPTVVESTPAAPPGVQSTGSNAFDAALQAFRNSNYSMALDQVNQAIREMPKDAVLHEFRSLVLFAQGQYDESAEAIYAVLAVGPGWDWKTMSGLYGNVESYTQQLRNLEAYVREQPNSSAARFLLAHHYMTCGHEEAAARQLKKVLELTPGQKVATDMLTMIEGPRAVQEMQGAAPLVLPPTASVDVPQIPNEQVTGRFKATGQGDAKFELDLNADGTFRWSYTSQGQPQVVKGVWAMDGNILAMEPDTGGVMLAELTRVTDQGFLFRMTGTPPDDPGLNFGRSAQ